MPRNGGGGDGAAGGFPTRRVSRRELKMIRDGAAASGALLFNYLKDWQGLSDSELHTKIRLHIEASFLALAQMTDRPSPPQFSAN